MVNLDPSDSRKQVWDSYWRAEPWTWWLTQVPLTAGSRSEIPAEELRLGQNGEHRSHWQQEAGRSEIPAEELNLGHRSQWQQKAGLRFLLKGCNGDGRKCWKWHMSIMWRCSPKIYVAARTIVINWSLWAAVNLVKTFEVTSLDSQGEFGSCVPINVHKWSFLWQSPIKERLCCSLDIIQPFCSDFLRNYPICPCSSP